MLISEIYEFTTCPGGGGDPAPDPPPCLVSHSVTQKAVNVVQGGGDPSDPGDGDPGYPDPTPDPNSNCDDPGKDTTKAPCTEMNIVNSRASDAKIPSAYAAVLAQQAAHGYEYGLSMAAPNWYGGAFLQPPDPYTSYKAKEIDFPFKWNSTDGYTTTFIHSHPDPGNAPSPSDILVLYAMLSSPDLQAGGADQVQYFKNAASMTAVSSTGYYTATVHDWSALQSFYNDYVNSTPDANGYRPIENKYLQAITTYEQNNPDANESEASAYALMTVMGSSINLYYASPNTNTFSPMGVNQGIVGPKNCN